MDSAATATTRFVAVPVAMLEEARDVLTGAQLLMFIRILADANWEPSDPRVRSERVRIDTGELLFSARRYAERCGLTRDQVCRGIRRLRALGWIETRAATNATHPALRSAARPIPRALPTIIRVLRWREIVWLEGATASEPLHREHY